MEFCKDWNIICWMTCVFIVFALGLNLFSDLICNNMQSSNYLSIHCLGFSNSEVSRIIPNWVGYPCDGLGRPCCLEAQRCSWRNQECKLQHCQVPQGEMFCHYTCLPIFEWIYSVQTEGNKNNSASMMAQFPSLALTCSSVFLFLWVFDKSEAFSNSVLKQFWLICIYFLKEPKFANSTNSSVVFKLVRSLVSNVNVVTVVIFSLNTASLNECG